MTVTQLGPVSPIDHPHDLDGIYRPEDHGLVGWSEDPITATAGTIAVNGTRYLIKVVLNEETTVSNVLFSIGTTGVTPTAGQNWVSIYNSAGTELAEASLDAFFAGGLHTVPIGPVVLPEGEYYIALLFNAATPPTPHRVAGASSTLANALLAAASRRYAVNGTVQTTNPSSLTLGNNTLTGALPYWVGLS